MVQDDDETSATCAPPPFSVVASVLKESVGDVGICAAEMLALDAAGSDVGPALESRRTAERVTCHQPMEGVDCFVLDNVLSPQECDYLVKRTEASGQFSFWDSRPERVTEFRNTDTIEVHDAEIAELLWHRVKQFVTPVVIESELTDPIRWERDLEGTWEAIGTNKDLLFARYDEEGHFSPHTDGYSIVDCDERSMYSIVLFLNDCDNGGGTRFYSDEQRTQLVKDSFGRYTGKPELVLHTVESKAGRLVMFYHQILHEGVPVGPGNKKYIIRSDVMFSRKDPVCKTKKDKEAFSHYQKAQELSTAGDLDEAQRLFRKAFKMSQALCDVYGM